MKLKLKNNRKNQWNKKMVLWKDKQDWPNFGQPNQNKGEKD
jgi:hypothetical protein